MLQTISIIVKGKVQGVFYRQSTREKATELGVTGTVCNLEDGSVKIVATGTAAQLKELLSWCRQGPPRAVVLSVHSQQDALTQFASFRVTRE